MLRSDEELMLSCRDGDEDAFEILYRRYEKPIFSFVYRMVSSAADAEDLCQETFLKVIRAKQKYRKTAKFKTWLFNISLNLCRDSIRRMKLRSHMSLNSPMFSQDGNEIRTRQLICDSTSNPPKHAQTAEMKALVQQAFIKLPQHERTVVILRQYHALKFSEIAEIMNCPLGTAKSLNHRGREKLMKALSKYMEQ
jgi:RNA polymerase sigma-70 factor (ECF subfamily)